MSDEQETPPATPAEGSGEPAVQAAPTTPPAPEGAPAAPGEPLPDVGPVDPAVSAETPAQPPVEAPAPVPEKVEIRKSLRVEVAEMVSTLAPVVRNNIVNSMVQAELDKRTEVATKVITIIDGLDAELKKLSKPDVVQYGLDGKPTFESYSKERTEDYKKKTEKRNKLANALEKALVDGEFDKLKELANNG